MTETSVGSGLVTSSLSKEFKSAVRRQTSLLAPLERICLNWFTLKMPAWVKPDHLTLIGFSAMLLAGIAYGVARWWAPALLIVNLLLAINWFGDSLDGTLARARKKQRPRYGFYVDHIVDAFGILFVVCGLALSGYMSWSIGLAVLVVYFMISIEVYLATYTIGTFKLSFCKISPTELRILLAIGNIRALTHPTARVFGERYLFFDVAALITIALMATVLVVSATRNTIILYRAERV